MFGFSKKKNSTIADQFINDLAVFSSDFKRGVSSIDDDMNKLMCSRAIECYKEKLPEEAKYSASDFFLNSLTGAFFELMDGGHLSLIDSRRYFKEVRSFLDSNSKYNSNLVIGLMDHWHDRLVDAGGEAPLLFKY